MSALSTSCAWIAFAINITITLRTKQRIRDFATQPDQLISLKIGPTSWIALAGAVSLQPRYFADYALTLQLGLTAGLLAWTIEIFHSPQAYEVRPHPRSCRRGSQGSIRSKTYSSADSSRRGSYV